MSDNTQLADQFLLSSSINGDPVVKVSKDSVWTSLDVSSMSQWASKHGHYNIHEVFITAFRYRFFLDIDLKVSSDYRWMSLFTHDTDDHITDHDCNMLTSYLTSLTELAIKSLKGDCDPFRTSYDIRNRTLDGKCKYSVHMFTTIELNDISEMKAITDEMISVATYQLNYYYEKSTYDGIVCEDDDEFEAFLELVCNKPSIIDSAPYSKNKSLSISGSFKDGHRLDDRVLVRDSTLI